MSTNVPYGNKGPDCRVRFTGRLGHELQELCAGRYVVTLKDLRIPISEVEPFRSFVQEARGVKSGFTANLGLYAKDLLGNLRLALKAIEHYCPHTQVKKAARSRRLMIDDYLGLSVVDRLADVVKAT
jgi:hypothetical protein